MCFSSLVFCGKIYLTSDKQKYHNEETKTVHGRKPIPTKIHQLRGNPGHRPLNDAEPQPPADKPACPNWLSPEAKKCWRKLAHDLHVCGVLTKIDGGTLAQYCEAWGRWVEAIRVVQEKGMVMKTKQGNIIQNPYLGIANRAWDQVKAIAPELGLTPSSRSRIKVTKPKQEKNPFDGF